MGEGGGSQGMQGLAGSEMGRGGGVDRRGMRILGRVLVQGAGEWQALLSP